MRLVSWTGEILPRETWEKVVEELIEGATLQSFRGVRKNRQVQRIPGDRVLREVVAAQAELVIEYRDGSFEEALGIAAGIVGADFGDPSYLTIVQVIGPDGTPLRVEGEPLFNDRDVPWLDRLRGSPAHVVRFELKVVEEEAPAGKVGRRLGAGWLGSWDGAQQLISDA